MIPEQTNRQRCEVYYRGRVQGVGFRYTVLEIAAAFELEGFVRNLADGRVQLVAEGLPIDLNRFLDRIEQQMSRYIVDTVSNRLPAQGGLESFAIRY